MRRPLDMLAKAKGKRIVVCLKNRKEVSGILGAIDVHLNMWLEDAVVSDEEKTTKYGKILIRGDTVVFASPSDYPEK